MIHNESIDLAVADLWITRQRKEVADFTDPIIKSK